ncbi:hypothetical protein K440DRAFT_663855 [Wilcoxina mikolae CBS 423.85]|nr:hypothetical protein K440DRAFT_663855 [Wilcoxina mikolae CBS 423.85]
MRESFSRVFSHNWSPNVDLVSESRARERGVQIRRVTKSERINSSSETQEGHRIPSPLRISAHLAQTVQSSTIAPTSCKPATMDIAGLLAVAITKHRNAMPLPNTPGAPSFHGIDVTTFFHKYESLAAFTATDITESSIIGMFPYYCVEESIRDKVMMMRGYADHEWATLKTEMLDAFRHTDSRPDSVIYTRRYLEQLCAEFGGRDDTESLKSFLRTYNHISAVLMECGMTCEYVRTEMLLRALPKRLWRKAITKLGMHPIEPSTFDFGKLKDWITAKITAAEALAMFEFLAPAAALPTTSTAPFARNTSLAPIPSPAPTARVPLMTSDTPTNSPASTSPARTTSASTTLSASLTPASMTAASPTAFTPSTPKPSLAFSSSTSLTAHTVPILTMAAETLTIPTAPTISSSPAPSPSAPSPATQGPQVLWR